MLNGEMFLPDPLAKAQKAKDGDIDSVMTWK